MELISKCAAVEKILNNANASHLSSSGRPWIGLGSTSFHLQVLSKVSRNELSLESRSKRTLSLNDDRNLLLTQIQDEKSNLKFTSLLGAATVSILSSDIKVLSKSDDCTNRSLVYVLQNTSMNTLLRVTRILMFSILLAP